MEPETFLLLQFSSIRWLAYWDRLNLKYEQVYLFFYFFSILIIPIINLSKIIFYLPLFVFVKV